MKYVIIRTFDTKTRAYREVARAVLGDEATTVTFEGDPAVAKDLTENGVQSETGGLRFPTDGERFLAALQSFLDNPNDLVAGGVQEGPLPPATYNKAA